MQNPKLGERTNPDPKLDAALLLLGTSFAGRARAGSSVSKVWDCGGATDALTDVSMEKQTANAPNTSCLRAAAGAVHGHHIQARDPHLPDHHGARGKVDAAQGEGGALAGVEHMHPGLHQRADPLHGRTWPAQRREYPANVRGLRGPAALDGNHHQHAAQRVVQEHDGQRPELLGAGLPARKRVLCVLLGTVGAPSAA